MWYFILGLIVGELVGLLISGVLRTMNEKQRCVECLEQWLQVKGS